MCQVRRIRNSPFPVAHRRVHDDRSSRPETGRCGPARTADKEKILVKAIQSPCLCEHNGPAVSITRAEGRSGTDNRPLLVIEKKFPGGCCGKARRRCRDQSRHTKGAFSVPSPVDAHRCSSAELLRFSDMGASCLRALLPRSIVRSLGLCCASLSCSFPALFILAASRAGYLSYRALGFKAPGVPFD